MDIKIKGGVQLTTHHFYIGGVGTLTILNSEFSNLRRKKKVKKEYFLNK